MRLTAYILCLRLIWVRVMNELLIGKYNLYSIISKKIFVGYLLLLHLDILSYILNVWILYRGSILIHNCWLSYNWRLLAMVNINDLKVILILKQWTLLFNFLFWLVVIKHNSRLFLWLWFIRIHFIYLIIFILFYTFPIWCTIIQNLYFQIFPFK